jgi:hypothetical protein
MDYRADRPGERNAGAGLVEEPGSSASQAIPGPVEIIGEECKDHTRLDGAFSYSFNMNPGVEQAQVFFS